jgi:hypothetical protein
VRVNDGGDRTAVPEVDLYLAQVLALFQQVRGIGMAQGVDVRGFLHAAGFEGKAEDALQSAAVHRLGGSGSAEAAVTFAGKEKGGMTVASPLLAQKRQRAGGQRDVTILVALASPDVEEHSFRIDVAHLKANTFAQSQAAGINGGETNAMIKRGNQGNDAPDFSSGKNDRELELRIGADQFDFMRPDAFKCFLPEDFDGADDLRAGLPGELLFGLEVNAILAELFGSNQVGRFIVELAELTDAGVVNWNKLFDERFAIGLFSAGKDRQEF